MAIANLFLQETDLVGTIVNSSLSSTGLSVQVRFIDKKTRASRTPQATTRAFTIDKGNSSSETILASSHSTTSGVTTITIAANGRNLPKFGTGLGSGTGNEHPVGAEVGCVTISNVVNELVKVFDGTNGTGGTAFRIGTNANNDIFIYAENGDANPPFMKYSAADNKWLISNDGTNTYDPEAGGSGVTAGAGIQIIAGVLGINLSDTTIFVQTSSGAGDSGKVPRLNASGQLANGFIGADTLAARVSNVTATATELNQVNDGVSANVTAANLNTLTAGEASNADPLHTHATLGPFNYTTAEAVNGSVTPQAVCRLGTNAIDFVTQRSSSGYLLDYGAGGDVDLGFGDVATSTRRATPFTYTNSLPTTRNLVKIAVMLQKEVAPTDNVVLAIQGDSGGNPDGTDITTATFSGSSLISGAFHVIEFTISGAALVSGTQYWAVLRRSTGLDAVNHYAVRSSGNAGTGGKVFNAGTGTWGNGNPFQMYLTIELDYDGGEIALADGDSNYLGNFIGFTKSNVASSGTAAVQTQGVVTGFTGLTPGAPYYLSTTAGAISLTPSNVRVGFAKSATELEINPSFGTIQSIVSNTYTFRCREGNSVAGEDFSFVVLTGFMPNFVSWSDRLSPSAASETAMGWTENYRGSTRAIQRISALDTSARTVNVQSVVSNASGAFTNLDAYYDNGFILSNTPSLAAQQYYELNYRANRI